jgi:ABC-type dipeptide/oligopeptide/nickel transport system ATPase component
LSLVFVSHDLAVVAQVCERVVVLREGRVVEEGPTVDVVTRPAHDYTRSLVDAVLPLPELDAP